MSIVSNAKKLHFEKNFISLLFSMMTRVLMNPDNQSVMVFKMDMKSNIKIFSDLEKQNVALSLKMEDILRGVWILEDMENGGEPIARVQINRMKSIAQFGRENFTISTPDGGPALVLGDQTGMAQHLLDNMINIYHPTHSYLFNAPGGEPVAQIFTKEGFFHQRYDLELLGGSEKEQKMALAVFAVIALLLRK